MTKPYKTEHSLPEGLDWELLLILMEECDEVSQRSSKAQRFGTREVQAGQELDNIQRLSMEIGDLLYIVERLKERGLVDDEWIEEGKRHKAKQLEKYLQSQ